MDMTAAAVRSRKAPPYASPMMQSVHAPMPQPVASQNPRKQDDTRRAPSPSSGGPAGKAQPPKAPKFCGYCGHPRGKDHVFCGDCGARFPADDFQ
jgi:hypothetical protein